MKRILIKLFKNFGLRVVGYHSIHTIKSNNPKLVEFLGVAGKSYYSNQYCKSIRADIIKPNFGLDDFDNFSSVNPIAKSEFLIRLIRYNSQSNKLIKRTFQSLEKIILQEVYKSYIQFWDEGLIKYNIEFIGYLIDNDPDFLNVFLNDYILVIVLPPFDVALRRYERRMKLKELNENFIDSLKLKYVIYEKFQCFLERTDLDFIFIIDLDSKKTTKQIREYLDYFSMSK